jgi:hypothetical protein
MKRKSIAIITISLIVVIIASFCLYEVIGDLMMVRAKSEMGAFENKTPEELFNQYVLEGDLQPPSKFSIIGGLEKAPFFAPTKGPVYIRFKTDKIFINALLQRVSQSYQPYTEISCNSFFKVVQSYGYVEDYPDKFKWWLPTTVVSPGCYRAEQKSPFYEDEAKYLLIDNKNSEVYVFRTSTGPVSAD